LGFRIKLASLLFCVALPACAFAAQITGIVKNATTNKPSSGDEVILLSLAGGMDEVARTKTDSQGRFTLNVSDEGVQHLVRVVHQGVNYHKPAPQGTTSLDITVYDAARQVANLVVEARVLRLQASGGELEVSESYTLRNESQPPRTLAGDQTLQVAVPEGARVEDGMVAGPGGMPTTNPPVAAGKKNYYAFSYPIRPGRSQFQIVYKLPYTGSREFDIKSDVALAEFGILVPKTMKFNATAGNFAPDSDESGVAVYFAKSVAAGQHLKFSVSGEGSVPREAEGGAGPQGTGPGGGLGAPIDAPAPLSGSRWYIIGAMVIILAAGAFWLVRQSGLRAHGEVAAGGEERSPREDGIAQRSWAPRAKAQVTPSQHASLLDVLKDELFQLENDRLRGALSQEEYEKQKAGLDALLRRQMKKTGRS
jgi:hypothetical protein